MKGLERAVDMGRPINLKWPNRNKSDRNIVCATTLRIRTEIELYALPVVQVISAFNREEICLGLLYFSALLIQTNDTHTEAKAKV